METAKHSWAKQDRLYVRLTTSEKAVIDAKAKEANMSVSAWIRMRLGLAVKM